MITATIAFANSLILPILGDDLDMYGVNEVLNPSPWLRREFSSREMNFMHMPVAERGCDGEGGVQAPEDGAEEK